MGKGSKSSYFFGKASHRLNRIMPRVPRTDSRDFLDFFFFFLLFSEGYARYDEAATCFYTRLTCRRGYSVGSR